MEHTCPHALQSTTLGNLERLTFVSARPVWLHPFRIATSSRDWR
jgi:hypothetical protein